MSKIGHANPLYKTTARKVKAGNSLSISSGKYIMIQRQGDGSYRISFGLQVPEVFFRSGSACLPDTEAARRRLLLHCYTDWSDEYKDLVRHSTDFRAWPLYSLSPEDMGWQSVQGETVAGDAAHLAHPGGEGVNLAMTDSLNLASKIADHGFDNIAKAIQEYEADMFPCAVLAITESKVMESAMCSEDPRAFIRLISS
jgi:2-polyprenyl-6-methoxyphenol hydroxylase-like FAD-dependent oxidoreductase